eukprot:1876093-Pleurochrysis_carterae.AAC.3
MPRARESTRTTRPERARAPWRARPSAAMGRDALLRHAAPSAKARIDGGSGGQHVIGKTPRVGADTTLASAAPHRSAQIDAQLGSQHASAESAQKSDSQTSAMARRTAVVHAPRMQTTAVALPYKQSALATAVATDETADSHVRGRPDRADRPDDADDEHDNSPQRERTRSVARAMSLWLRAESRSVLACARRCR